MTKPSKGAPKRWIAVVMSMLSTGLGHVYFGQTGHGLIWGAIPMACTALVTIALRPISASIGYRSALGLLFAAVLIPWVLGILSVLRIPSAMRTRTSMLRVVPIGIGLFLASRTLAMGLRAYAMEAFRIPSGSMIPTLLVGDHLFVDKGIYRSRAPRRGDVIVFEYPEHPEQTFIKRVIAIPGDRLEVKGGHPFINGWEVPSCKVGLYTYAEPDTHVQHEGDVFVEFLMEDAYLTFYDRSAFGIHYYGPFDAKNNDYWVLGDNRNNAHDSRMWWGGQGGGVPLNKVIGRAMFAWISVDEAGVVGWRVGLDVNKAILPPEMKEQLSPGLARCMNERPTLLQATPPG